MHTYTDFSTYFAQFNSVVIAYSGGVDSSLIAVLAKRYFGERAQVISFDTPLIARSEVADARALSDTLSLECHFIELDPFNADEVRLNVEDRCYFCKYLLFAELAKRSPHATILDGTNADDLHEHRPGLRALKELKVRSPLAELGITKAEVREIAAELGLPNAQKLSAPCLATRFATGDELIMAHISCVEKAEERIRAIYAGDFRIRMRDDRLIFELK